MRLEPARAEHATAMAKVHGTSFEAPWNADDIAVLLEAPGGFGVLVIDDGADLCGFVLVRAIVGEAEILTLAVDPAHRRQGLACALVEAAVGIARGLAAESMFLEVAADNVAAIALYHHAGFAEVGRRPGYYQRAGASPVEALIMRRDLNSAPA